ncbi:MAG TPA: ABC transporter ATP-binding protein [Anaerolineales bacterium]|nr:ABC transporter ATP-binding protein [Anaerolineales bacterium]
MSAGLKLAKELRPYWRWVVLAPLLMMLEVAMDLLQPRMVERIIDEGIARLDLGLVLQTGLLMFGLAVIGALGGMSNGFFAESAAQAFGADLRERLFRKVQAFAFVDLEAIDTGQLITRLTNDVTQVQEALLLVLRILVRAPLLLLGSLIMAVLTSPSLAWLPLVLLPIELVAVVWLIQRVTPLFTRVQERLDALNQVMQENLAGARVVKAFVRAAYEQARFGDANQRLTDDSIRAGRTVAVMPAFMMFTLNASIVAVLWFGGVEVSRGGLQLGQVIAFINYLTTALFSLIMVSHLIIHLARAEASAKRILEVLDRQPAVQNRPEALTEVTPRGRVTFEDVTFDYQGRDGDPVLRGVSFTAEPGQTVALIGATGSGKSSLVHLIPRFYDVTGGRVTIDGHDVRDLDLATLRRNIGIALQEAVLFSGTIRDNIRYGRPDATEAEVEDAARAAQAHDFIQSLSQGYDTLLGQRGVNLSGGQKQRLAIARALLVRPAVLILDDSTSAVDVETETRIQAALEEVMRDRTSFVIAQRISTVLAADKILVLDDGQIVAEGTHRQLLAESPIYREIYDSQLGGGERHD